MSTALRRRLSWAAVVAGLALAVGLALWLTAEQQRTTGAGGVTGGAAPAEAPDPGPEPAGLAPPRPRLEIPSIDVAAHAVDLGLNRDGSLEVPKDYDEVGVWKRGPDPGERGPAVIAGHVDYAGMPGVFGRLPEVQPGDEISVARVDGTTAVFTVYEVQRYPKSEFPTQRVYGNTETPELRLITCGGVFDEASGNYLDNVVVYGRMTSALRPRSN